MILRSTKKSRLFFELTKITGNQKLNIFVLVLVFFALIFIFVNSPNLNITKVISQIISQANRIITSQSSVNKDYLVIDSFGRAKVMSPRGSNPIKTVAELSGKLYGIELENKGGFNNAIPLESGSVKTVDEFMQSNRIKISYILGMTTEPNVSGAVEFVKASVDAGMMPIIRLCYDGGCGFNISSSADQIIDFYRGIAEALEGTDYEFIAVLGPNEPGTGKEAEGFGVPPVKAGGYSILVQRANEAAQALQEYRFENGGPMYLAPAIFNVTNTQNDDVNAYLFGQFGPSIDPNLFDYLLGNSYNLSNGDADYFYAEAIGSRPQSMKAYAEANNLPVIFTEIGFFAGDYLKMKDTYKRMCSDNTIEGLLFFRPLPPNTIPNDTFTPRQDPPITSEQLKEIIDSCQDVPDRPSGRKRWFNANFDSCVPSDYVVQIGTVAGTSTGSYSIPESVCSILKDKKRSKIINFGDSLSDESTSTFSDPNIVKYSYPGASTRWFVGEKRDITIQFQSVVTNTDAFVARILLGTNDIGTSSGNSCMGIPDLNESVNNIKSIANTFASKGIIPIIVSVPARDKACQIRMSEFNDKIVSEIGSKYPIIRADQMYTINDLRDDRHLRDYSILNNTSKKLINEIIQKCQVNTSSLQLSETQGSTENQDVIQGNKVGTRFVSGDKNYGLGYDVLKSCGREFESKDSSILTDRKKGPQFLLKCSGGGCNISWKGYVMVETPIRSLASTNPVNSAYKKSFTPASVLVASYYTGSNFKNKEFYDPLNQFAHGLKSENFVYPVPWLGSYINNTSELIKATDQFAKVLNNQNFYPSSFSIANLAKKETEREINFTPNLAQRISNTSYQPLYSIVQGSVRNIPDERALCLINKNGDLRNFTDARCLDNREFDLVKAIERYDFTKTSQNWKKVEAGSCGEQQVKFLNSSDEYLPGPEVNVSEGSLNFSNSEICWRFGNREIHQDTKNYWSFKYDRVGAKQKPNFDFGRNGSTPSCTVKTGASLPRNYDCDTAISLIYNKRASDDNLTDILSACRRAPRFRPASVTIQEYCTSIINQNPDNGENQVIKCQTKNGKCNFPEDTKDVCFSYLYSSEHETYIKNNSFPDFQEYSIPKLNDSLYHMYTFLNNLLSARNLRFTFGEENYGWRVKVHSILRDENKREDQRYISTEVVNYPYLFIGESEQEQCVNDKTKFFDNKSPKARGRSDIVEYQYFPWAGALDVMQEILMTYALNTTLPEANLARNSDGSLKLKNGKPFLQSYRRQDGTLGPSANLASSRPFLTCDEIIACKEEKDKEDTEWCPIKDKDIRSKIIDNFAYACIDRADAFGMSVNNYPDKLADYLCNLGYIVEGKCNEIKVWCEKDFSDNDDVNLKVGRFEGVYCPIQSEHYCFQGPFGGFTHCDPQSSRGTLPLDLFSKITVDKSKRDMNIYAPEDSTVISVNKNDYGTRIDLKAKTGIIYAISHLEFSTVPKVGTQVKAGQKIGEYDQRAYDYNNLHIHVSASYNGAQIDPYLLYGEILGCNAVAPDKGMKYLSQAKPGMCRYGNTEKNREAGIVNGLNDNKCLSRINTENISILSKSKTIKLFEQVYRQNNKESAATSNYCQSSLCKNLEPKSGVPYPICPNIEESHCDDHYLLARYFAKVDIPNNLSCEEQLELIASSMKDKLTKVTLLGVEFTVNSKIVPILQEIDAKIKKIALSYNSNQFLFNSGAYQFISMGGYNPRRIRGTENSTNCLISNHSFGIALDFNSSTNPYTSSCSDKFDIPPEVVQVFEEYGFRWGGRFSNKADYMHFDYCPPKSKLLTEKENKLNNLIINYNSENSDVNMNISSFINGTKLVEVVNSQPKLVCQGLPKVRPGNNITRDMVLKLCSPQRIDWVNLTIDDVYNAYNKITKFDKDPPEAPNRTDRIKTILEVTKKININPVFAFGIWFTEGGFRGDGVAGDGTKNKTRNAYGYDFGCGLKCDFVSRDGETKPTQAQYDEGFTKSLGCLTKTNSSCNLKCMFENILSSQPYQIPKGPRQEGGLGGFLECYGPISDNNQYFARNFIRVYDAFFPPESNHSHRRIQTQDCLMYLN